MKKFLALLVLFPSLAWGATYYTCDGTNTSGCPGTLQQYTYGSIEKGYSDSTAPDGDGRVLRWTLPAGMSAGHSLGRLLTGQPSSSTNELWVQYYWKYSANYEYNGITNKQMYMYPGNTMTMGIHGSRRRVNLMPQGSVVMSYLPNIVDPATEAENFYAPKGVWYKYTAYFRLNTGTSANGIYKAWVEAPGYGQVLISDYSNVVYDANPTTFSSVNPEFIWGGTSGTTTVQSYFYMDSIYIGNTAPVGDWTPPQSPVIPYAPTSLSSGGSGADSLTWTGSYTATTGRSFTSAEMATMKYYIRIDKPNPRDTVGSTGWNQSGTWYYVGETVGVTSWPSNNNLSALLVSYGFAGQAVRITVSQLFNDGGVERESQLSNVWTWTSDGTPPFLASFSPANGATGVPDNTTSFSFQYGDAGTYSTGANLSALSVSCPGYAPAAKTCASGGAAGAAPLTCSGTSALYTITFPGLSLGADNVVNCAITGADLEDPANLLSATYSFTVAAASPVPLSIDTTTLPDAQVGVSYSAPLTLSGGQPPYACDNTGVLPPGVPLSSNCSGVGPGVPTTAGTYNFTLVATDAQGGTDSKALSLTVLPAAPGGKYTLTVAADNDTYINAGSPGVNYSTLEEMNAYVWPERVEANTILDKGKTSGLPDSASLDRSIYRVYLTGYEGAGIDNMVLYVRPVTGTVNPDNVTWSNFSGYTGAAVSSTTVRLTPGWVEFDVTAIARAAYAAGKADYLVSIGSGTLGARDQNRIFASSQHPDPAKRPHTVHTYTLLTAEGGDSVPAKGKFRYGPGSNPKHFSCVESPEPLKFSANAWKIKKYGTRPEIWLEVEQ